MGGATYRPARSRHHRRGARRGAALGGALWLVLSGAATAQDQNENDGPALSFGLTTGLIISSNRGLDATSPGSTTELTTRLDFDLRFATPIQSLTLSGDIGLRTANGAESDDLDQGIFDPNVALDYTRQSRDAALNVSAFVAQRDVTSTFLQAIPDSANFDLLTDSGTLLRFGADTALELRRQSPFGVTFSAGYTGLRYFDTTSPDLTDQDRFRLGAAFRFDLNPALQATLDTRFSTFEDDGTDEGRRDTIAVNAGLRQSMSNGDISLSFGATNTEDGTRYTLTGGRSFVLPSWTFAGSLGITRGVDGEIFTVGALALTHTLRNGLINAEFERSVVSSSDDIQQDITTARTSYSTQLNALTTFNVSLAYTERNDTGIDDDSSFGTISLGLQRSLSRDWSMDIGLQHRIIKDSFGPDTRDNRLSLNLRRDLSIRR